MKRSLRKDSFLPSFSSTTVPILQSSGHDGISGWLLGRGFREKREMISLKLRLICKILLGTVIYSDMDPPKVLTGAVYKFVYITSCQRKT